MCMFGWVRLHAHMKGRRIAFRRAVEHVSIALLAMFCINHLQLHSSGLLIAHTSLSGRCDALRCGALGRSLSAERPHHQNVIAPPMFVTKYVLD